MLKQFNISLYLFSALTFFFTFVIVKEISRFLRDGILIYVILDPLCIFVTIRFVRFAYFSQILQLILRRRSCSYHCFLSF